MADEKMETVEVPVKLMDTLLEALEEKQINNADIPLVDRFALIAFRYYLKPGTILTYTNDKGKDIKTSGRDPESISHFTWTCAIRALKDRKKYVKDDGEIVSVDSRDPLSALDEEEI